MKTTTIYYNEWRPLSFKILILLSLLIILFFGGCRKFIEVDSPSTSVNTENVFASDVTAAATLTGLYTRMSLDNSGLLSGSGGISGMSLYSGMSADELVLSTFNSDQNNSGYFHNSLSSTITSSSSSDFWLTIYPLIYKVNAIIEGLNNSSKLTPVVKTQLLGEAYFLRGFYYFYLVNLYGDVPLATGVDFTVNSKLPRATKSNVYVQIKSDLSKAVSLLNFNYVDATVIKNTTERVRPNKFAASALLARVHLFTADYVNAETQSTSVINNSSTYSLVALNNVFLKNSLETLWSLQPVTTGTSANTGDGRLFILPATGPGSLNFVYLNSNLLNSFEIGDLRRTNWVNSVTSSSITYNYAYKYKVGNVNAASPTEYTTVLRLAEQYLIRAEARAQQNKLSDALSDLNVIRTRAGLPNSNATTQAAIISAINHERQVELFTEWGHRWLDLKRTQTVDAVMPSVTIQKGGTWKSTSALYPIPLSEIQLDFNLTQNPGYSN